MHPNCGEVLRRYTTVNKKAPIQSKGLRAISRSLHEHNINQDNLFSFTLICLADYAPIFDAHAPHECINASLLIVHDLNFSRMTLEYYFSLTHPQIIHSSNNKLSHIELIVRRMSHVAPSPLVFGSLGLVRILLTYNNLQSRLTLYGFSDCGSYRCHPSCAHYFQLFALGFHASSES